MGRAGRDGLASDCVLMYSWADVIGYDAVLDEIEDTEVREETRKKTRDLFRLVDRGGCRHQRLVRYFDEEIAACGTSCDVCRGTDVEALVAGAPTRSAASTRSGANSGDFAKGAGLRAGVRFGDFADASTGDPALFERLRVVRKRLADAEGVPAYIVFSDAVLRQMAAVMPKSVGEMLAISGVGPVKLERYGEAFLEELRKV